MPSSRLRSALVLLLAFAAGSGCQDAPPPAIGFTVTWGDDRLEAFMQAAVNRAPGMPLRIAGREAGQLADLGSSLLAAEVSRATVLAADPEVMIVVGPGGSREALQVGPIYRDAGVVNVVPTASSRLLATMGPWTFRMAPDDSQQGAFMGAFADTSLGARSAAIFYVSDEYGIGLATGIAAELETRGISIVERVPLRLAQPCLPPSASRGFYDDLAAQLALRGRPDVVLVAARTVETGCLAHALRTRWSAMPIVAGDGAYFDQSFLRTMADASAEDVYLVTYWHRDIADSASRVFVAAFEEAVGRPPRHGDAVFYDAVMLAATAVREAGADRDEIRQWLAGLGTTRPAYDGIAGPISFAPGRSRGLLMTQIRGNATVMVGAP